MIEVYTDAHGLLVGPVNVGVDGLDAGPFKQTHHKAGGQHFWHLLEFSGFRVKKRYGFIFGNLIFKLIGQAGF